MSAIQTHCCVECGDPVPLVGSENVPRCARIFIGTGESILWCSPECMEASAKRCQGAEMAAKSLLWDLREPTVREMLLDAARGLRRRTTSLRAEADIMEQQAQEIEQSVGVMDSRELKAP